VILALKRDGGFSSTSFSRFARPSCFFLTSTKSCGYPFANRSKVRAFVDNPVRTYYSEATLNQLLQLFPKQASRRVKSKLTGAAFALIALTSELIHYYEFWTKGQFPDAAIVALTYFFVLLVCILVYAFLQDYRLGRKARYAEAIGDIGRIYEKIRLITIESKIRSIKEFEPAGNDLMDSVAKAFGIISNARVAVCVKVLNKKEWVGSGDEMPAVRTLFRDEDSKETRERHELGKVHWLSQNSGLRAVWESYGEYFFSNDLSKLPGYSSTFVQGVQYWTVPSKIWFLLSKWEGWKLPFRSEMIVAISTPGKSIEDRIRVRGFLCVDSRSRGVFDERYGIEILQGIASALGPAIAMFHESVEQRTTQQQANTD
jgi:hypothetical protein